MAVLPTGFGKSLIYQLIPKVLERLRNGSDDTTSIICVVSPLEYIREQQVANITKLNCGLRAAAIGEDDDRDKEIERGSFNIVFGSAEQWLTDRWKKALQFGSFHCIDVLVVDEVHTMETGYVAFRSFLKTHPFWAFCDK